MWWVQGLKEIDAYQSDPTKEKSSGRKSGGAYGPEMLETWLLLEYCDRYDPAVFRNSPPYTA